MSRASMAPNIVLVGSGLQEPHLRRLHQEHFYPRGVEAYSRLWLPTTPAERKRVSELRDTDKSLFEATVNEHLREAIGGAAGVLVVNVEPDGMINQHEGDISSAEYMQILTARDEEVPVKWIQPVPEGSPFEHVYSSDDLVSNSSIRLTGLQAAIGRYLGVMDHLSEVTRELSGASHI